MMRCASISLRAGTKTVPVGRGSRHEASSATEEARRMWAGKRPAWMSAALRAMSPVGSCLKMSVSSMRGTRADASSSCRTAPGPTCRGTTGGGCKRRDEAGEDVEAPRAGARTDGS
eukprot:scaffold10297_cov113-Isochrysis_galbana.AAC.13